MASARPAVLMLGMGWHPDVPGGLNRYFRDLLLAFGAAGAPVAAVTVGPAADVPAGTVVSGTQTDPLPLRVLRLAAQVLRRARAVPVLDVHFAVYGVVPLLLGVGRRTLVVVHFHGPWAGESAAEGARRLAQRAKAALEGYVYRRADLLVVLSSAFRDLLVEGYGVDPARVAVIPPGIDLEAFTPGDRAVARERLGVPAEAWTAVTVRRLVDRVGIDTLIAAWAELGVPEDRPRRLLVCGEGPVRAALEAQAEALGIAHEVRFVGRIADEDLVALYRAADLCVLPTRSLEGFGLVILESLACGTPVVGTDVGGIPETLTGLQPDLVVPPEDPRALGRRLGGVLDGSRPAPGRDEARRYAERFSWSESVAAHQAAYAGAAARRRKERGSAWTRR